MPHVKKAPNSIDHEIGRRIRARRQQLGLNQQSVADEIGVWYQQVQKYENGGDRVGASRLFAIARALSVPISYFFDDHGDEDVDAEAGDVERHIIERALAEEEGRSLILSFSRIRDPQLRL
ncbi:helix-turn-helix domain-containing protein, partial [Pantanalinema rosaneae CENA516]|uniref:helix-turn-helix domain-containing protein n=1 Tax=Pantanalinema rosaneae TaxID=1620701 RepID=UPI003D6F4C11